MTRTAAARRPGLSLLEVIVALFVMAIGMISLLTLFPLGALQMGQALRDARAAETCSQADTMMRLWWQRDVVEGNPFGSVGLQDPAFGFLDNPQNTLPALPFAGDTIRSSYPVFIDPIGWDARTGKPAVVKTQVAGGLGGLTPRRSMFWITNDPNNLAGPYPARSTTFQSAFSFRTATMMDDITFNEAALPDSTSTAAVPGTLARQGRYNWTAVIQRPDNVNRFVADLKILVFDGRAPGIAPADAERVFNPAGAASVGTSQIVLNVGATPPDYLRAGSWIMDGTLIAAGAGAPVSVRNAVWYRIQSIDKDTLAGAFIIDLQTPLLRPVTAASQIYVFKGLLEVFDRPQLAPPDYKKQVP